MLGLYTPEKMSSNSSGNSMSKSLVSIKEIPALILCGGKGTRLRSVLNDRPKSLAITLGQPFITLLLSKVKSLGFEKAILCTGHLGDQIKVAIGNEFQDLSVLYSHETQPLGTGGAIMQASRTHDLKEFFVFNGDSYPHITKPEIELMAKCDVSCVLGTRVLDASSFGSFEIDEHSMVTEFKEKDASLKAEAKLVNAGVYYFRSCDLERFAKARALSLENEILPSLSQHRTLKASLTTADFVDIGTPERLRNADDLIGR